MPALKPTEVLDQHQRIAFQFSGGKDSTAALYALRAHWPRMTVYWLNTGDPFPETEAFVREVAAGLPHFVEVAGRVNAVIAQFGPPADLIGAEASETAWAANIGRGQVLQDRAACCLRSKMLPLHQRMIEDGITLIVRGQKAVDEVRGPLSSGDAVEGVEVYHPIEDWTDADVMAWLIDRSVMPPLYGEGVQRSGDCMRCSAWLGDRRAAYLAQHHPVAFGDYTQRIFTICAAAEGPVGRLFNEAAAIEQAARRFQHGTA